MGKDVVKYILLGVIKLGDFTIEITNHVVTMDSYLGSVVAYYTLPMKDSTMSIGMDLHGIYGGIHVTLNCTFSKNKCACYFEATFPTFIE